MNTMFFYSFYYFNKGCPSSAISKEKRFGLRITDSPHLSCFSHESNADFLFLQY